MDKVEADLVGDVLKPTGTRRGRLRRGGWRWQAGSASSKPAKQRKAADSRSRRTDLFTIAVL